MDLHLAPTQKIAIALAGIVLFTCHTGAAAALTHSPIRPNATQEWGNDVVHVTSADPDTVTIGPSGASLATSSGGGDDDASVRRAARTRPRDEEVTVQYCVEIDLDDNSSGPYRVSFHFDDGGDDNESAIRGSKRAHAQRVHVRHGLTPKDDSINVTFDLGTTADATAVTTGDTCIVGAIYDDTDTLVASDDGLGDHISTALAAGEYTLVLTGGDLLAGDYMVMADQGTCGDD
jgi:hypothetical protein